VLQHTIHLVEVFIGIFIGAITFTGSIIAWGKLDGKVPSKPWSFKGLQTMNLILLLVSTLCLGVFFCKADGTDGMPVPRNYDCHCILYWSCISNGNWWWRYASCS
jgi:NAD/NADP transhydrogenase beta subunit